MTAVAWAVRVGEFWDTGVSWSSSWESRKLFANRAHAARLTVSAREHPMAEGLEVRLVRVTRKSKTK